MAEFASPLLCTPKAVFTCEPSQCGKIIPYVVTDMSPLFWENECLLIRIHKGRGTVCINQIIYPIEEQMICILHAFHVFQFQAERGEPLYLDILIYPYAVMSYMDVRNAFVEDTLAYSQRIIPCLRMDRQLSASINRAYQKYQAECDTEDSNSRYLKYCLCAQIVHLYYSASAQLQYAEKPLDSPLSKQLFEYLYLACYNPLTAKAVSQKFGITIRQMNLELRRICGDPFPTVLQKARVGNACAMMLRTGITFRTISKETGFPSESTFYRMFHEVKGCTPQEYQEQLWDTVSNRSRQYQNDVLTEVHKYVLNNFRTPISLKSCAEALYLPCSAVDRTQKAQYGNTSTFHTLLRSVRLEYAKGLLTATTLPVYDVAVESGFNSVHTLIRAFKSETGMTPTQFREVKQRG